MIITLAVVMSTSVPSVAAQATDVGLPPGDWSYIDEWNDINNFGEFPRYVFGGTPGQIETYLSDSSLNWRSIPSLGSYIDASYAINDCGQLVGYSNTGTGVDRAIRWTPEDSTRDLGALGEGSWATEVNEAGWIAGNSVFPSGEWSPFVRVPSDRCPSWPSAPPLPPGVSYDVLTDLGACCGVDDYGVQDLNDVGDVVVLNSNGPIVHLAGQLSGTALNIGAWELSPCGGFSRCLQINNRHEIAAIGHNPFSNSVSVLRWRPGFYGYPPDVLGLASQVWNGAPSTPAQPFAIAINDRGQILARNGPTYEATLWDPGLGWRRVSGSYTGPAGTYRCTQDSYCGWTEAFGFNNEGEVVGSYAVWISGQFSSPDYLERGGFAWYLDSGGIAHFRTLPPLNGQTCCAYALGISDAGQTYGLSWDLAVWAANCLSTWCYGGIPPFVFEQPPMEAGTEGYVLWERDSVGDSIGDGIDSRPDAPCIEDASCAFDDRPGSNPYDPFGAGSYIDDGTTFGKIVARNGNLVAVVDVPEGLTANDGVKVINRGGGFAPWAVVKACAPPTDYIITGTQGLAVIKCNTLHLAAAGGEWTIDVPGNLVVVPPRAAVKIEDTAPGEVTITSDPNSTAVITVGGVPLHAGESITVSTNAAPVAEIDGPESGAVYAMGTPVAFGGSFTDANPGDTHTAMWDFDGIAVPGIVEESGGAGTVTADHVFTEAGIYRVTLTVSDNTGASDIADAVDGLDAYVVVYDPSAGFVTGGGWYFSPLGAYLPDPAIEGRASFGFVSKYQRHGEVPNGETEFQFELADLDFRSTSYDWLVCGGPKCQFKGQGTINRVAGYSFMLTAIDGQLPGGGGQDKIRMKIWVTLTGQIVYDNQIGAGDFDDPTTVIGGGSIVIHKG